MVTKPKQGSKDGSSGRKDKNNFETLSYFKTDYDLFLQYSTFHKLSSGFQLVII